MWRTTRRRASEQAQEHARVPSIIGGRPLWSALPFGEWSVALHNDEMFRRLVVSVVLAAVPLGAIALGASVLSGQGNTPAATALRPVPADLLDVGWLRELGDAQVRAIVGRSVFAGFQFRDRQAESGITFRHRIVDDAGKTYKAVHYDHGSGLAAADVDGDGRTDLYFVNQAGDSQLWRNIGGGRFEDITAAAGIAVTGRVGVSASFGDVDNDGDADLYVTTVRGGNLLFANDGRGGFHDITASAGVGYTGHSSSAVFFDYNRDGRLDLFLVNVGRYTTDVRAGDGHRYFVGFEDAFAGHLQADRAEASVLYRNDGKNRFTDVTRATGLVDTSWSGDASVVDGNDDGWPDLYVLNMQGPDEYYENQAGVRFIRKSRAVFPRTSWGAMGIKVFDVNADGRLDIFVTDMHSDMSQEMGPEHAHAKSDIQWDAVFRGDSRASIWGNSLFVREASGQFREASDEYRTESYWPWGLSAGDLNADGFDDVFITAGMNYPFRYAPNSVKLNERGRGFVDAEFVLGVEPRAYGVAMPWFELDASGADRTHRDAAGASGRVTVLSARASRSSVMADIDADGDLDVVTNEFNAFPMVLVSDLSERTSVRRLEVRLEGTRSNRDGLGAVVSVTAGGATAIQVHDGNSGYLSHSLLPLYFGLGSAEAVERVDVLWPSGVRQTVRTPTPANGRLVLREPAR